MSGCTIPNCERQVIEARGMCGLHYQRWRKHGNPTLRGSSRRHGHTNPRSGEYTSWAGMIQRCGNPNNPNYAGYGGDGVTVCERWRNSFEAFLADMGPRPSPAHSLDRYPNREGSYEPGNVRWATDAEQTRNQRTNHLLTIDGVTRCLEDWSRISGISRRTVDYRLKRGLGAREAIFNPPRPGITLRAGGG
jgi:hypothetical protein